MVALKFCKDTINFWVNKYFWSTVWVGNTALSFKDENTALAKIEWRGLWQLVLGRIVAIAPIDSTWWIDVEFGGDCHDRPSQRLFALLLLSPSCASGCAFACNLSTICHLRWRLEADWHQSRTVSDDLLTPHYLPSRWFFGVEICYKERALLFGQGS